MTQIGQLEEKKYKKQTKQKKKETRITKIRSTVDGHRHKVNTFLSSSSSSSSSPSSSSSSLSHDVGHVFVRVARNVACYRAKGFL